jgi:hypothetical protein
VDGAVAGIIFKADPQVGDSYQQEYYEDEAEDMAEVVALNVTATLTDGTVYDDCVKTREWTRLLPGVEEFKYYAPDVGLVLVELDGEPVEELVSIGIDTEPEIDPENFADSTDIDNPYMPLTPGTTYDYEGETEDGTETTEVFVSDDTKVILGVTCVVVEDRVYLDGELIEETFDWYAQDNEGNVWYFGEDSAEYEDGEIVSTAGSWEAGVDGAQPGIIMKADPRVGDSYRQEYYEGEAEDLAAVLALEQSVSVPYGDFDECLQTLDWAPLVANSNEYKYYAPGIGMVLESKEDGSEPVELISITD